MEYLRKVDAQLLKMAYARPYKNSFVIRALIFMGDGPFWLIVLLLSALAGQVLGSEPLRRLVILLMVGLMLGNLVFLLCKTRLKRRRPYADRELQQEMNITIVNRDPGHGAKELESFPSGHVLWTTISVSLICSLFGPVAALLLGWMIPAMMYLRLHLGVHYPSDALAGLVLGGAAVAITLWIVPGIWEYTGELRAHAGFPYGYWAFIGGYVVVGIQSWLKRV